MNIENWAYSSVLVLFCNAEWRILDDVFGSLESVGGV
jgi:hypothetical protein